MPSFDTVLEADLVKLKNAVENCAKEIGTRFDFKGTAAAIEIKDKDITLLGDGDFQIDQINDILRNKLAKAGVDVRFLDLGKIEKIGGDKVKQVSKVRNGIAGDDYTRKLGIQNELASGSEGTQDDIVFVVPWSW